MSFEHLIIAIFSGLILYFSLLLSQAPQSIQNLEEYKNSLEENIQDISYEFERLQSMYYWLSNDPQAIIAEARKIGMVFLEDSVIQLYPREERIASISPGERIILVESEIEIESISRSVSLSTSLIILFILLALGSTSSNTKTKDKELIDKPLDAVGSVRKGLDIAQLIRSQVVSRK